MAFFHRKKAVTFLDRDRLVIFYGFAGDRVLRGGTVVEHFGIHVLLRVDVDLFSPCRIIKLQLIKSAAHVRFGADGHLRLCSRQAAGGAVFLVVGAPLMIGWSGSPLRKSTITS
ncbi:Uncharacterised protein [Escherichia coli]|uniref:Uncharacterized protein n=1 Tax=Escherichia coli TaxID=562 RepID=A0A376P223_ECOLX|nr:Uncharacterised protein [Escherichia coli]